MRYVYAAVEGKLDRAVAERLIESVEGLKAQRIFEAGSRAKLLKRVRDYNRSALRYMWFVLVDLDRNECAPELVREHLPNRVESMCFRVAVRMVEAWLMADREGLAEFLGVSVRRIPRNPESIPNPKGKLVGLAKGSRRRHIREALVPPKNTGAKVGSLYTDTMMDFVKEVWNVEVAAENSDSLSRALRCLNRISRM